MATNMTSATVVSLSQMVDLALKTPEVGVVNFTVLRTLLQVMLNRLQLSDTQLEFRGADSERIQSFIVAAGKSEPCGLCLTEYGIASDDGEEGKKDGGKEGNKDGEAGKGSKKVSKEGSQLVVSKEKLPDAPHFSLVISKEAIEEMQKDIENMKNQLNELKEIPTNKNIIKAIKSDSSGDTPVLDMYQVIALSKRMDAAEITLTKLASLIEDIVRGKADPGELKKSIESLKTVVPAAMDNNLESRVAELEKEINEINDKLNQTVSDSVATPPPPSPSQTKESSDAKTSKKAIEYLQQSFDSLKENFEAIVGIVKELQEAKKSLSESPDQSPEAKFKHIELKVNEFSETLNALDSGFSRQFNTLATRLTDAETQLGEVMERIHLTPGGVGQGEGAINELKDSMQKVESELNELKQALNKFGDDMNEKQKSMDILVEEVELLKTTKADKEDIEDALADKADTCLINRKVSFEQFDQACGDMTKNIEEALSKLTQQEGLWNQALEDLQKNIGSKMDRQELTPLKDFINTKLKGLQEKFKTLSALKKEQEAAATKSKFLRNVNCISCDNDVVMRKEMDPSMYPKTNVGPPKRNMAPYLAYELDQLRRQQKCLPTSKNMNLLENAMVSGKGPKPADHICNRYCGGSHTVTTPQQRVTRMGHFLEQWGPEIAPVNDTNVKGTDGRIYKGRDDEQLMKLATEKPPSASAAKADPATSMVVVEEKEVLEKKEVTGKKNQVEKK